MQEGRMKNFRRWRSAAQARAAVQASVSAIRTPEQTDERAPARWISVLVSLRGIEEAAQTAGDRATKRTAMLTVANARRAELLAYLRAEAPPDAWRAPSEVTAFGTFSLECTRHGLRILRHAPHVESVMRTDDTQLELIR